MAKPSITPKQVLSIIFPVTFLVAFVTIIIFIKLISTEFNKNTSNLETNPPEELSPTVTITSKPTYSITSPSPVATIIPVFTESLWVKSHLANMTLNQKIGQMIMTRIDGTFLTNETCDLIQNIQPGAVVYLGNNVDTPDSLKELSAGLQRCAVNTYGIPLIIAIDHEGQYVDRFRGQLTIFPSAMAIGATGDPELAYEAAFASGQELLYTGVNTILGPVADVLANADNTVISLRSYGGNPEIVGDFVSKAVNGYLDAGILPVLKHFPGHGSVQTDSHSALPIDLSNFDTISSQHLVPFRAGIQNNALGVMMSHVAFPNIDQSGLPSSLSISMYQILKQDLDFRGMTISDSLGMGAIGASSLSESQAAVKGVQAGMDMVLVSSPDQALDVYNQLVLAVESGELTEERIDQAIVSILYVKSQSGISQYDSTEQISPTWEKNRNLAIQIGERSITVIKDEANLIPIPHEVNNILIIGPKDYWGLYTQLNSVFQERGLNSIFLEYTNFEYGAIPEIDYLNSAPDQAKGFDMVVVFTWEAHLNKIRFGDSWQSELVQNLINSGTKLVVIAMKSPVDLLEFPDIGSYAASYGTTEGQIQGIVDVLMGKLEPNRVTPLPNLLPVP